MDWHTRASTQARTCHGVALHQHTHAGKRSVRKGQVPAHTLSLTLYTVCANTHIHSPLLLKLDSLLTTFLYCLQLIPKSITTTTTKKMKISVSSSLVCVSDSVLILVVYTGCTLLLTQVLDPCSDTLCACCFPNTDRMLSKPFERTLLSTLYTFPRAHLRHTCLLALPQPDTHKLSLTHTPLIGRPPVYS